MQNIVEYVTTYIEQHQLLPESGRVIVAVSGGADSLCLLHLLHSLCGPGKRYPGVQLHIAHLDHQLRGKASAGDADAVARLATAWKLPVTIGLVDVAALALREQRSLEDAARTARYRFLREVAQGQPIAVAHHEDDQVETLLLHWLRGGGIASMIGLQPRQQDIIRPLLCVSHADTLAYCQQHDLMPLEDASNTDPRFLRNRIRHELLPLLESLNPGIRATLLRNAEVMGVDAEWIEQQVDMHWPTVVVEEKKDAHQLSRRALLSLPLSLQRHLLRRVTSRLNAGQSPLELRHYQLIEALLHKENNGEELMLHLPHQLRMVYVRDTVVFEHAVGTDLSRPPNSIDPREYTLQPISRQRHFQNPGIGLVDAGHPRGMTGSGGGDESVPPGILPIPGRVVVPGTPWTAVAEIVPDGEVQQIKQAILSGESLQSGAITQYALHIDADCVGDTLLVRTRKPGDRIRPLGMTKEKKVQDILVDKHIARSERMLIPLFFSKSHCVWLAGVCLDDRVRLTEATERIVRLSILPT
jgi:tRNA(Ile)-lysidine synthase